MLTEFKRVKHGEHPGDISRRAKIRMREAHKIPQHKDGFYYLPWQFINWKLMKSFKNYLRDKSRTVQRRRDKRVAQEQMET